MTAHRALTGSVLAHAALLAAIAHWVDAIDEQPREPADPERAIAIEVVPPAPPVVAVPIDVALLEDVTARTDVATARAAPPAIAATRAAGSETAASTTTGGGEPAPAPSTALAMRGRRHDLTLSGDALARIAPDRPLHVPAEPTGRIHYHGRTGRMEDPVAKYKMHADGTIDIEHKPEIELYFQLPFPTPGEIMESLRAWGKDIAAWTEDPYRDQKVGTWQDLPKELQAIPGACNSYSDISCTVGPTHGMLPGGDGSVSIFGIIGGRLDITGWFHHKFIGDPYASRKLKMLDTTRAERVERGTAFRKEQLDRSAELTARNLEALSRTTLDPAARREALFELWDECVEGDGPTGAAGTRARAMVIGWIRTHLPAGSADAYSPDEVARLDAKRASAQHFAPY